jgi:MFS family permease
MQFEKDLQYYKFCAYGFLKNLRFFEPFLVLFFLEKGLSFLQIGTLYAIREIATNLLEIPTGFIADALGRRRTLFFSFVFYILSFIIFFFFSSFISFIIAMALFAIGEAFRTGVHKAMIFTYLKLNGWADQKVHYYGHTRSWSQMGSAISSLLAAAIVFQTGAYQTVFAFATIPYFLDMILIASYPDELDGQKSPWKKGEMRIKFTALLRDFFIAFRSASVLKAVNNISIFSGYFKAVKDYLQPVLKTLALSLPLMLHLQEQQRSSIIIGLVYFFIFLMTSFMSKHSGWVADYFSNLGTPLNFTLLLGLIVGILAGWFYFMEWTVVAVLLYVLIYLLENLRKPMGVGYFADQVQADILASALSAQSQIRTIWAAIIALILGATMDQFGIGPTLAFTSVALLLLVPVFWLGENKSVAEQH